ncbi:hypothetical protein QBC32DRAFT_3923 [Pseudoneurospora amorphoporcata]|uniref:Uncharacterized protein n=1 Tax=Pseudoneurospora amorphoporcata TaxID=241081 RepID=A0AAN6NTZ2_9PEZI|nr:hypothetical protein QBC32DRAFT_3923 [Pseudoneurospora amorphoporcata]
MDFTSLWQPLPSSSRAISLLVPLSTASLYVSLALTLLSEERIHTTLRASYHCAPDMIAHGIATSWTHYHNRQRLTPWQSPVPRLQPTQRAVGLTRSKLSCRVLNRCWKYGAIH